MGHKTGSLVYQVEKALTSKSVAGQKKHDAKQQARASARAKGETGPVRLAGIYSYTTLRGYMDKCVRFARWAQAEHGCRTLADCRQYTAEYLQTCKSASTATAVRSAMAKLYGCKGDELGPVPTRHRADITRSRGDRQMDRHFSEERNRELVDFCKATGLRRSELRSLRGDDLDRRADGLYIHVRSGKGGRERYAPVRPEGRDVVERLCQRAGSGQVFGRIHAAADVHGYRADYATALYRMHARPLDACKADGSVMWLRGDRKGQWLDKAAAMVVSEALGHSRLSVVAEHYIKL